MSTAAFEERAVEWSRNLHCCDGASVFLGEGAHLLPITAILIVFWFAAQHSVVPVLRLVHPAFVEAVRKVAREKAKDKPEKAERDALRDVGVRAVALIFAVIMSYSALVLRASPPREWEKEPDFAGTPFASFYCAVSVGYFVWDLYVTVVYGYGGGFLFHAIGGLAVEAIALHPYAQEITSFAHLFELSTPFLNLRLLLISSGWTSSLFFKICENGFGITFLVFRILFGWAVSFAFVKRVVLDLSQGNASRVVLQKGSAFVPVAILAVTLCVTLGMLNGFWFLKIVRMAKKSGKPKTKSGKDQ